MLVLSGNSTIVMMMVATEDAAVSDELFCIAVLVTTQLAWSQISGLFDTVKQ